MLQQGHSALMRFAQGQSSVACPPWGPVVLGSLGPGTLWVSLGSPHTLARLSVIGPQCGSKCVGGMLVAPARVVLCWGASQAMGARAPPNSGLQSGPWGLPPPPWPGCTLHKALCSLVASLGVSGRLGVPPPTAWWWLPPAHPCALQLPPLPCQSHGCACWCWGGKGWVAQAHCPKHPWVLATLVGHWVPPTTGHWGTPLLREAYW